MQRAELNAEAQTSSDANLSTILALAPSGEEKRAWQLVWAR